MKELIDRETAIHRIYNEVSRVSNDGSPDHRKIEVWAQLVMEGLFRAVEIVKKMEAEETGGGRWIPCSERMPEENEIVCVTAYPYGKPIVLLAYLDGGKWFGEDAVHWERLSIRAWMPLPEPWEGEEDGRSN